MVVRRRLYFIRSLLFFGWFILDSERVEFERCENSRSGGRDFGSRDFLRFKSGSNSQLRQECQPVKALRAVRDGVCEGERGSGCGESASQIDPVGRIQVRIVTATDTRSQPPWSKSDSACRGLASPPGTPVPGVQPRSTGKRSRHRPRRRRQSCHRNCRRCPAPARLGDARHHCRQ